MWSIIDRVHHSRLRHNLYIFLVCNFVNNVTGKRLQPAVMKFLEYNRNGTWRHAAEFAAKSGQTRITRQKCSWDNCRSELLISYEVNYALWHLHWLPTDSRISFKLSTITFKALGSGRPLYPASLLHNYSPPRTMRSSSAKLLTVPRHNLSLGSRGFRISALTTWNSLPQNVRDCSSLASFRNHLKYTISVLPSPPSDT